LCRRIVSREPWWMPSCDAPRPGARHVSPAGRHVDGPVRGAPGRSWKRVRAVWSTSLGRA